MKVERYISGKRPSYAKKESNLRCSDNNDSEEDNFISRREGRDTNAEVLNREQTEIQFSNDDTDDCQMSEHEISNTPAEASTNPIITENNIIEDTFQDIADVYDGRLKRLMALKREACQGKPLDSENKSTEHANTNSLEEKYKPDGIK